MILSIDAENNSSGNSDVHPPLKATGLEDARFKSKMVSHQHFRYCLKLVPCYPRTPTKVGKVDSILGCRGQRGADKFSGTAHEGFHFRNVY